MDAASDNANASERAALSAVTQRLRLFPRQIGRYQICARLGEGGMGAVYSGFDPELDRRVAIKLLARPIAPSPAARFRMLREAQALGAISHPNVVGIYEVGVHEELPFIAMEHVEAPTLRDWLRGDRRWRQILGVFYQCAAGLAAAHARGIVHRDFKPSNVLVSNDGRVRVLDFGLARLVQDEDDGPTDPMMSVDMTTETITLTGAVVGTPGYMAPEQHLGALVGPGADQYAFCVALWEALYGVRPFSARSSEAYLAVIRRAQPKRGRAQAGVPRAIATVLRRGLRLEPRRRHPSMDALVLELREAARQPSMGALAIACGAVGIVGAALVIADSESPSCEQPAAFVDATWNAARRAELARAFADGGESRAWLRVETAVDRFVAGWRVRHEAACSAVPSEVECLEQRMHTVSELLELFAEADPQVLGTAAEAAASLPSLDACAEAARGSIPAPSAATRAEVDGARGKLARAAALHTAGRNEGAAALAAEAAATARTIGYKPLLAEALLAEGKAYAVLSDHAAATPLLQDAYAVALAVDDHETAMTAALVTCQQLMAETNELDEALRWWRHAEAAAHRMGLPAPPAGYGLLLGLLHDRMGHGGDARVVFEGELRRLLDAQPLSSHEAIRIKQDLGKAYRYLDRREESIAELSGALALAEADFGRDSFTYARMAYDLGAAYADDNRFTEAAAMYRRALATFERVLPSPHPKRAEVELRLGFTLLPLGERDEAIELIAHATAALAALHDDANDRVIFARATLADAYIEAGRPAEAEALLDALLATAEASRGPSHGATAQILLRRGKAAAHQDRAAEAEQFYRRSIAAFRGADDRGPAYLDAMASLAMAVSVRGEHDEAVALADEALAELAELYPADHPVTLNATRGLLRVYGAAGRAAEWIDDAERVVEGLQKAEFSRAIVAEAEFELARTLVAAEREETRAMQLAENARDVFARDGSRDRDRRIVEAWLAERR